MRRQEETSPCLSSSCKTVICLTLLVQFASLRKVEAHSSNFELHSPSVIQSYFAKYLPTSSLTTRKFPEQNIGVGWFSSPQQASSSTNRRPLANEDDAGNDDEVVVKGTSVSKLRTKISEHRMRITRLKQQAKDLAHERGFLEKTLELKKGQRTMQDGQVKLSQAELEDKAKEIEMYKREAPRTLSRYNDLVRKQRALQETLNRLHQESEELSTSRNVIMDKIQHMSMEELIERHARGLPEAMAGAIRKSAAAVIPFFDYLMIAADTNNRLVDHVGAEIDKYTHVNISQSPFMSGMLFYCVMLVPLLTFVSFARRVFDSSSNLTVSHYIILGNFYFVIMCLVNLIAAFVLKEDPMTVLFRKFERPFVVCNLMLSIYFAWHVIMLGLQAVYTVEKRDISQFTATVSVGVHYFLFAWRRVFTDNAPMMYSFNYLVYGTIFCFILYERYNRMSSKQLSESAVFRLVQIALKRKSQLSSFRGAKLLLLEMWSSISPFPNSPQKRFSRRYDRYLPSEKVKFKSDTKERSKPRRKLSSSSEDVDGDEQVQRNNVSPSNQYKKGQNKQSGGNSRIPQSRGGFISIFFGSRENGSDSADEENESQPQSSWRLLRGGVGNQTPAQARAEICPNATRSANAVRSHRMRDRKEPRSVRTSIWKWP